MTHRSGGDHVLRRAALARVEGEGAMCLHVSDGRVTDVELTIFEPPRFFEAMLRGRGHTEPPDITARICGICPVAYQTSACHAIEDACGVTVPEHIERLRRVLYCGEWVGSHALHVHMLHLPDFLGYDSALAMAADHREIVERGLRLKKAGNAVMTVIGGRAVHPVNVRVGGFYRLPTPEEVASMRATLTRARDDALDTATFVGTLDMPAMEQPYEYAALRAPDRYPIESGEVVTTLGRRGSARDYDGWVREEHVERSTALHATLEGDGPYVTGPLARYTLNSDRLSPIAREAATAAGLGTTCRNPFQSLAVRAVEMVYACDEALSILSTWDGGGEPFVDVPPADAVGYAVTEAPRGLLLHRYRLAADGTVLDARIVPPTSQNQAAVEADLRAFVQARLDEGLDLDRDLEALTRQCELAIRNYDPCISCATHFLDLTVVQE